MLYNTTGFTAVKGYLSYIQYTLLKFKPDMLEPFFLQRSSNKAMDDEYHQ